MGVGGLPLMRPPGRVGLGSATSKWLPRNSHVPGGVRHLTHSLNTPDTLLGQEALTVGRRGTYLGPARWEGLGELGGHGESRRSQGTELAADEPPQEPGHHLDSRRGEATSQRTESVRRMCSFLDPRFKVSL